MYTWKAGFKSQQRQLSYHLTGPCFCLQVTTPSFPVVVKMGHAHAGMGKVSMGGRGIFIGFCFLFVRLDLMCSDGSGRENVERIFRQLIEQCKPFWGSIQSQRKTRHMSFGPVCPHGLGFLFRSQTCYRISHKAQGELGRLLQSGTWFDPSDLTEFREQTSENIWDVGRGRFLSFCQKSVMCFKWKWWE